MFYPENNLITFLDTNTGECNRLTIDGLIRKYNFKKDGLPDINDKNIKNLITSLYCKNHNILIRDWDGWSQIYAIVYRKSEDFDEFYSIKCGDEYIIVNNFTDINVYTKESIDNPIEGFHGELKYKATSKSIKDINEDDYIMFYNKDLCTKEGKFIKPVIEKYNDIHSEVMLYNIYTKSKKFNIGKFYLF